MYIYIKIYIYPVIILELTITNNLNIRKGVLRVSGGKILYKFTKKDYKVCLYLFTLK